MNPVKRPQAEADFRRRTNWLRAPAIFLAVSVALPWTLAAPQPTLAAPSYKHPLFYGREFKGTSYPTHNWGLDIISTTSASGVNRIKDQEVLASAAGTVNYTDPGNGQINIDHGGGSRSVYAHMDPVVVGNGDPIAVGQLLGYASDKGPGVTGYHLHYGQDQSGVPQQVRFNGTLYNYQYGVLQYGPNVDSTHLPSPPATDIWDEDVVSPSRRTAIGWLYQEGITTGCGSYFDYPAKRARYCPESIVLRDQMASFLDRYLDLTNTPNDYFTDDEGNIHEQAINNVAAAGITSGCGGTNYCPSGQVTRGQMATFLNRPLNIPNTPNDYFTDDEGSIHEQAINNIRSVNITSGCGGTNYCPNGLVTRGQMASYLYNGRNYR